MLAPEIGYFPLGANDLAMLSVGPDQERGSNNGHGVLFSSIYAVPWVVSRAAKLLNLQYPTRLLTKRGVSCLEVPDRLPRHALLHLRDQKNRRTSMFESLAG
jgi:hypothetical protein